jgi:PKD repeat protein
MFVMKRIFTLFALLITAFGFQSKAQTLSCNADFNFAINGFNVQFTPVMVGDSINTTHYWSFGDGAVVSAVAPAHTYAAVGGYYVKHYMVRHNTAGAVVCTDSVTKLVLIQTTTVCNLQAYFTWQTDSLNFLKIHFTNQSVAFSPTDSIRWNFGDGTVSYDANPIHTYANAGTYNVCIRVKKNNMPAGVPPCISEICKTVYVVAPCNIVANFNWTTTGSSPLIIAFHNLTVPVSTADSVRWTFGDGSSSLDFNPIHTYTAPGTYNVCLRVKRNNNVPGTTPCISEICKTVIIAAPCTVAANYSWHADSLNAKKIIFTNLTVTTSATATAIWSFGDGTTAATWNAVHEYANPGKYYVCLRVENGPLCISYKCDSITIANPLPPCNNQSNFALTRVAGNSQTIVGTPEFQSSAAVYTWTFGDGTGTHDMIATHHYTAPGTYNVCLTVWRSATCASTTCRTVVIVPQINCDSIHVSYSFQRDPFVPNKVYFYANANFPILDQTWTITRLSPATTPPVILHQNNPVYVFHDTGYYRVCLKAITLGGCVKEYCNVIRIENVVSTVCELQAYPNPASSLVNVNVTLPAAGPIDAYVYNTLNVLVKEKHQSGISGSNTVSININDLLPGLYTIKVIYGGKTCYARFNKL